MKKALIIILAALVAVSGAFAGGAGEGGSSAGSIQRISIGTAGTSGSLYPMGVAMAKTISDHVPGIACTGEATAASVENIRNLTSGNLAMGISQSEIAYLAYNGLGDFAARKADDLRAMFSTIYSYIQIFTLEGSPVNTISDLKGRSIAVGSAGSGGEMASRMILEYYGLTYNDLKPQFIPDSEAVTALKDGKIDAMFVTHPLKSAALMDLTTSADVKMIPIDDPDFYENFWFWTKYEIPAGTYENVDVPVNVPISRVVMLTATKSGLTDDQVYEITKSIWENRDEWANVTNSVSSEVKWETVIDEIPVPLHPGAIRYLEEKGVDIPETLIPPEMQ